MKLLGTLYLILWPALLLYVLGDSVHLWHRLRNWRFYSVNYFKRPERRGFDVLPPRRPK